MSADSFRDLIEVVVDPDMPPGRMALRQRDRHEALAAAILQGTVNLAEVIRDEVAAMPRTYYFLRPRNLEEARRAERYSREQWIADVKARLGLVTIGDPPQRAYRVEF